MYARPNAVRLATAALLSSQSAPAPAIVARLDRAKAITATTQNPARLISTLRTKGTEYTDRGPDYYEKRYRQRVTHPLAKRAERLCLQHDPIPQPA